MSDALKVVDTTESIVGASLTTAVGRHHTLPTALADLVDNSIDARAEHVLIRFVRDGTRIVGLKVVDDGCGMSAEVIDAAMQYGNRRHYGTNDLGHFGVGLKAASLSQAGTLLVWSKTANGGAQGRMIEAAGQTVSRIDDAEAASILDTTNPRFPFNNGTVVEWKGITTFLMSADEDEQVGWLEQALKDVRTHLGIVFHRKLVGGIRMTVDVFDCHSNRAGPPRTISPIDPFGYPAPGAAGYPRSVSLEVGDRIGDMTAHIWPARSGMPEYRLFGAPGRDRQGFYFYRNDRLLQIGGWNGLWHARPDYGPARVAVELDDELMKHVRINPEKAGVTLDATSSAALRESLASLTENGYLADTVATTKAARSRTPRPITVLQPAAGLPEDVLDAFSDAFTFDEDHDPVELKWRVLARDRFFEVDLKGRTLYINARFRTDLAGRRSRDTTDVPVVKTLLYLLVQQVFAVRQPSPKQQQQIQAWQDALVSAMTAHRVQAGGDV